MFSATRPALSGCCAVSGLRPEVSFGTFELSSRLKLEAAMTNTAVVMVLMNMSVLPVGGDGAGPHAQGACNESGCQVLSCTLEVFAVYLIHRNTVPDSASG